MAHASIPPAFCIHYPMLAGSVVLGYARYLGIDPETEPRLVDVAREALTDPMPPGWERHLNEEHCRPFFFSPEGITTWEHPLLQHYLAKVDGLRASTARTTHWSTQSIPPSATNAPHLQAQLAGHVANAHQYLSSQYLQPPLTTMQYWPASLPYHPLQNMPLPLEAPGHIPMPMAYGHPASYAIPAMEHASTPYVGALHQYHAGHPTQHPALAPPAVHLPTMVALPHVACAQLSVPSMQGPPLVTDLERLRHHQVERYQQQLRQLHGQSDLAYRTPSEAPSSSAPHWQEQRRRQWQRLQELQHDHIERQLQHHDDHNDPRSNHGPVDETRAEAAAVGATADKGGMPPTERKASEETVRCASLESAGRLGECAGGAHGTEEEPLPSLKQLAAPLLGIMGSALQRTASAGATAATALKRRGSAAAAAASAAAGAGHGAAAVAAAVAFAQAPGSPAPPPPPPAGIGGGSVAQLAAAEVEAAENAFRAASEVWTATLGQQREALPSSAARLVNQVLGDARARVESVSQQLRAELEHAGSRGRAFWPAEPVSTSDEATAPGSAKSATMLTKSAVDACAALGEARDARVLEVEATLRACEKRLDALRSTRHEASASLGGNTILPTVSSDTDEPSSAEVVAADKALKDLDSSAAFELEQALWRGGLRGAALQARVASELNDLREQWREHRAKAEHAAVEEARQREAQKKSLAAYVRRSMLDAATHSLSRLLDVATATAGDLTAVALRALHQRTIAMHRGLGTPADDGALTRDAATSSLVQHLVSGGEALMVQLHAELATLVEAVAAAATQVEAWVRAEEELRIVARQADVQSRGAVGVSERALEARCAVFDGDVLQLRYRALEGFGRGLTLMLEFGEALLVGELLRVAPSWGTQQSMPPPPYSSAQPLGPVSTTRTAMPHQQAAPQVGDSSRDIHLTAPASTKEHSATRHSSLLCGPPMNAVAACPPTISATPVEHLALRAPYQRTVARPCASLCASLPRAPSTASAEAGSASPHTPQALQLQHSRVPAFDPAESSAEAGTPLTRGAASTAFAEVWLNSRGSLLSPGSLPTANMSVTPLTAVDDGRLSVGTIPVLSSPPSCLASTTHTAEPVGAPPAAAPAEEELVARQLLWEEESDAAAAATAAEETGEEVAIAIIAESEQGEMAVEEMLAFLDEAAQLVGLPKPSEQIQEQTRLESRPAQVEDV